MENIEGVTSHLRKKLIEQGKDPSRGTLTVIPTKSGSSLFKDSEGVYWRSYTFIEDATCYQTISSPEIFKNAAKAFGHFQKLLADYPADTLHEIIPNFHMQYIYDNIMYAELNTKSDYCQCCGYDGEIKIVENADGKLIWQCPNCGNTDQDKMNVARRTCGYIGTQYWNQGRTQEIKDRVLHL